MVKFVVVTGGVISGIGKGVISAAIGTILQNNGHIVTHIKIDPYLNVDAGNMGPAEHGEVFVTADGTEVDLDIGHYERCQNIDLNRAHSITTGRVYQRVIERERAGEYLGQTVQVVPHIVEEILDEIKHAAEILVGDEQPDYCIIELGGTIGDIESQIFVEALGQLDAKFVHVSLIPFMFEHKTKPTQHSVKKLRESGINPDLIICRATSELPTKTIQKIINQCRADVITVTDTINLYKIPFVICTETLGNLLGVQVPFCSESWERYAREWDLCTKSNDLPVLLIAGKYDCLDAYKSLLKAIEVAMIETGKHFRVQVVNVSNTSEEIYRSAAGIIVAGGFGSRGFAEKIKAVECARVHGIPFLGICYGFQAAVCDYVGTFLGLRISESSEEPDGRVLKWAREDQKMVLGNKYVSLVAGSQAARAYNSALIVERARHRWSVNPSIELAGDYLASGHNQSGGIEIIEHCKHRFFVATQFHPEFTSKLFKPHPLFKALLTAMDS